MVTAKFEELADNLPQIEAWLQRGEEIELTRRGEIMARVVPAAAGPAQVGVVKADFAKRMKEIWGDFIFTDQQIREMREADHGERS